MDAVFADHEIATADFKADWPLKFFTPTELRCRGTGLVICNWRALEMLDKLRGQLGKPVRINSAGRSYEHNRKVKGAKKSKHLSGIAFDIPNSTDYSRQDMVNAARDIGFNGFGFYEKFIHIDARPKFALWSGSGASVASLDEGLGLFA